ncbi:MAG: LysM peptidoglycan-binding domain-containing protein [Anaerolineae bacterium]|nr:LysM peptidoglycan-binding domain-containing protein [Anaerolineae bacterium]
MNHQKRLGSLPLLLALSVVLALCVAAPMARAQGQTTHVVQPGENLFRIALRYGTTVDAIRAANGLANNLIYVGQQLVIPGTATNPTPEAPEAPEGNTITVQVGDTLSSIALRRGVTVWTLMQANDLPSAHLIYPGQQLAIPSTGGAAPPEPIPATYAVQPGDTLASIGRRFNTTASALAQRNGLINPALIYVGQVLQITGSTNTAPAPVGGYGAKAIVVNLSEQHLYAYQGGQLVYSFIASSGAAPYYTRTGEFHVQSKVRNAYGSTWNIWMPYWLGIYWAGSTENGIHALPELSNGQTLWAGYLGSPVSFGCIVLGTYEAGLLYEWADIGTPVTIRY